MKCIKSVLRVCGSDDLILTFVAHGMTEILFIWELYNYTYYTSVSMIPFAHNTGKRSDTFVMKNLCTELFIIPILSVKILSINVTNVVLTLKDTLNSMCMIYLSLVDVKSQQ